ncbi:MAG: histidine kinase dimerization/phospho-acceptor domain-containing protein [Anaerolineales bacterium]|nr:histidine kinase dimerization/phospho-acceptor domain-containing protein [Anaerolineales bacterium]
MSLRLRLTLLYSALTGGILLVFGMLIFGLVSILLIDQADRALLNAAFETIGRLRVNPDGELVLLELLRPSPMTEVSVLIVAGEQRKVEYRTGFFLGVEGLLPLPNGLLEQQVFADTSIQGEHLRILNVPLQAGGRRIGILQLAYSLNQADAFRSTLFQIIVLTAVGSVITAAAASWLSLDRALAPLAAATKTALQIVRADDLARRVPLQGIADDEIGQLVTAFNETLERLEQIFNMQQRFLADVSHELRTPLTVIKANVALMRRMGRLRPQIAGQH